MLRGTKKHSNQPHVQVRLQTNIEHRQILLFIRSWTSINTSCTIIALLQARKCWTLAARHIRPKHPSLPTGALAPSPAALAFLAHPELSPCAQNRKLNIAVRQQLAIFIQSFGSRGAGRRVSLSSHHDRMLLPGIAECDSRILTRDGRRNCCCLPW